MTLIAEMFGQLNVQPGLQHTLHQGREQARPDVVVAAAHQAGDQLAFACKNLLAGCGEPVRLRLDRGYIASGARDDWCRPRIRDRLLTRRRVQSTRQSPWEDHMEPGPLSYISQLGGPRAISIAEGCPLLRRGSFHDFVDRIEVSVRDNAR